MKLLLLTCTALAIGISGCTSQKHENQSKPVPTDSSGRDWGFLQFSEVRAFRLNWDEKDELEGLVREDNTLNTTRMPKDGVKLRGEQVDRLQRAVMGNHSQHPTAACFYPHHAFAFYDDGGRIVGHIDICFLCSSYRGEPGHFAETWDLEALAALMSDLKIPFSNPRWD